MEYVIGNSINIIRNGECKQGIIIGTNNKVIQIAFVNEQDFFMFL